MKVYLAGVNPSYRAECEGHHILVSFAQKREMALLRSGWSAAGWLLNSGAFTAWKLGTEIRLDDYIAACHQHLDLVDAYIALDVIGDADGSWRNFLAMRDTGLDPMPVFHEGDAIDYLDRYQEPRKATTFRRGDIRGAA